MKHPFNGKRLSECDLKEPITAIVCLPLNGAFPPLETPQNGVATLADMIRPLQQVTLRPDKLSALGYIRLGETPGDEAMCWVSPANIRVVEVLGRAVENGGKWTVEPYDALGRQDIRDAA